MAHSTGHSLEQNWTFMFAKLQFLTEGSNDIFHSRPLKNL